MPNWTFWDYLSDQGKNYIEDWVEKTLSVSEQEEFSALLRNLRNMDRWKHEPFYKSISAGKTRGLGELRFDGDRKKLRVFGADEKGSINRYVLLIGCSHKQRVYDPPNAMETAARRKGFLESGIGKLRERKA